MSFSLSTKEGHMIGSSFVAQSSSLKRSAVAARAKRAAFRAWTNGSLSDRENAAARTLARVCQNVSILLFKPEQEKDIHLLLDCAQSFLDKLLYLFEFQAVRRLLSLPNSEGAHRSQYDQRVWVPL